MTEKLYYQDAYIREFDSVVTDVINESDVYLVALRATAFFPEEGGQTADGGTLSGIRVLDVIEREGTVYHKLPTPLTVGDTVHGVIDFDERFEKMQCHTAEHIVCGIIHRLYGYDNVGFHLGSEDVTLDINADMTREMLDRVEEIANRAVADNVKVTAEFPSADSLGTMEYRSKLDLTENVRIVTVENYDACACCAPHVSRTGEIGIIKLLDFMKHRGGVRIHMQAGFRALRDYRIKYENIHRISAILSTPQHDTATAMEKFQADHEELKANFKAQGLKIARIEAERVPATEGNAVYVFPDMSAEQMREFLNNAGHKVSGMLVVLSGNEGNYQYIIYSSNINLREKVKEINSSLCGRGGGRPEMIQGTFAADLKTIREFFE